MQAILNGVTIIVDLLVGIVSYIWMGIEYIIGFLTIPGIIINSVALPPVLVAGILIAVIILVIQVVF